jgi:hypothetical protein
VSEWMLISVKDGGLVFHHLRLHKDNKLEIIKCINHEHKFTLIYFFKNIVESGYLKTTLRFVIHKN